MATELLRTYHSERDRIKHPPRIYHK